MSQIKTVHKTGLSKIVCVLDNRQMTVVHQMQIYFIVKSAKGILYLHKLGYIIT